MKRNNVFNSKNNYKTSNIVNILIILGNYENGLTTVRHLDKSSHKYYNTGYLWDIWQNIEKELKDKYVFKYHYTDPKKNADYEGICNDIYLGKYDLCLGLFRRTKERERKVNFCAPVLIDANTVVYKDNHNEFLDIIDVIKKIWKQFVFLLLLGITFGLCLRYFDKSRSKYMEINSGNNYLFRAIMTGIASVFGEMGYLSERTLPTIKSTLIATLMMIIAFIIILYIQGEITSILVKKEIVAVNKNNIGSKPILGKTGYADLKAIEAQGATIKSKNKNFDNIIKIYLENSDKYLGIGMSYTESIPFSKKYGLKPALGFGFYNATAVISKKYNKLREEINYHIAKIRNRGIMQRICHSYYGESEDVPTCALR